MYRNYTRYSYKSSFTGGVLKLFVSFPGTVVLSVAKLRIDSMGGDGVRLLDQPAKTTLLLMAVMVMILVSSCGSDTPSTVSETPTETSEETTQEEQPTSTQRSEIQLPDLITWSAYDIGSTGYAQTAAFGDVLKRELGVSLRVIPAGNDIARLSAVRLGRAEFSASGVAAYFAQEGILDFATQDWGPQPFQLLWMNISDSGVGLNTTQDSGIKTPYDLKGKRVAWIPGAPALNTQAEACMYFGNVTWDDVIKVEFPSYAASVQGLTEGTVDAAFGFIDVPALEETAASPRGFAVVEMPHEDKEGWERLQSIAPWIGPHLATRSAGQLASEENPLEVGIYPYPIVVALADQDEELTYNMTRAIHELYDQYYEVLPAMWGWRLENRIPFPMPYHPGAVRYLKEIGNWTDEDEARQQEMLRRQEVLQQAFEAALDEAAAQGISSEDFTEFWLQKREEALAALN